MIIRIALFACVLLMTAGLVPGESPRTAAAMPNQPQQVLTFVDGYGGNVFTAKDIQMESTNPFYNGGGHANIQFERYQRALMEFNLSSIPASATVLDATLYLYHSRGPEGNGTVGTIYIYSISAANKGWVAGTKDLEQAGPGEACWGALASNGNNGVQKAWAGSAGLSTSGVDFEPNAIGSFVFDEGSPIGTEYAIPLNKARVQGWLGPNNTNYGIVFFTNAFTGHVAQSSNRTTQLRPKLVVHYTLSSVEYKYHEYLPALKK